MCQGSVTFSAEGGAPAATSNQFPVGTRLRVTNLDNNKSAEVTVTGPSGSCVLLNASAMELVREPGKNVIRRNLVERLDGGAAQPGAAQPGTGAAQPGAGVGRPGVASPGAPGAAPQSACQGPITFSGEAGAPAATSGQFPVGTRMRVTNLDNGKSTTVTITGPSGSCVLLNAAAMEQIREPGKNLVRRNTVEVLR
ncbi:septal ring lytic transglycosylase RlpA family protein [Micromonospora deserti]|uniref:septal ring lytic transglycosylase RlpA family protein n=1 Tax=Micromonospora deserti TaxID=2070366 RepID=UPI001F422ED1|nr:septal ring lytic transglycosylase RlpA family protein [Micromonospora deserti]